MNIVIVNVVIIGNNLTDIIDYLGIFLLNVPLISKLIQIYNVVRQKVIIMV